MARIAAGGLENNQDDFVHQLKIAQQGDEHVASLLLDIGNPDGEPDISLRDDGILLRNCRILVPDNDAIKLRILKQKHDHPTAGHPGITKTMQLIARDYAWPSAKNDVADYIGSCVKCARNKTIRQKPYGTLQPLPVADRPWSSLSMDYIEQLPNSGGFDSILVIIDYFTKMGIFIPTVVTATSKDLAECFLQHVWSKHGLPDNIVSDRGSKFISKFWSALCRRLGIDRKVSTAYHPQTDGQTERVNQTLEQYIRMYCAYQQDDWHEWLPLAEFAYNNADHTSTGVSPFKANYGYDPNMAVERGATVADPGNRFAYKLDDLHTRIRETLNVSRDSQKAFADKKRQDIPEPMQVNSLVMLSTRNLKLARPTRKFAEKYIGPFRIIEKISEVAFKLDLPPDLSRIHPVFHVSLLRHLPTSELEGRIVPPPGPIDLETEEYEVEDIVDSRIRGRALQYKVKWKGYENQQDEYTWEPAENVAELTDLVDYFHNKYSSKPSPSDLKFQPTFSRRRQ